MKILLIFICTINLMINHMRCDWLMECGPCKCKWISGKKTADCKNTTIVRVPDGLSTELQVLDLSSNHIPEIYNNEFAQANLRNLHKLFVRNCTLQSLHRNSLKGLEILIELDLSFNFLKTLPRSIFSNLIKIRALILNNNKIERLDDGLFRNLSFLHKIELKENSIVRIETKAFTLLPVLTQIYLDGNQLTILKRECFQHLELTGLSLKQNPWNCTCELKPFRDFAFEQNLYTPPTDCYYPETLHGTLWSDVSLDAFACRPKIIYPPADRASVSSSSDNVTITCRIQASPNTLIAWTYNKHALSNHPKRIYIKNVSELNKSESKDILTTELTIVNVRQTDEGTYTCTAENVGGKDEIDIELYVGRNINGNFLLTHQLMFVLCLMAVGLLIISIVIMIVTCCYCRKFKNLTKHDLDTDGVGSSIDNGVTSDTKKHFQTIKLNSFNNSTLIGNGSIVTGCSVSGLDRSNKMNGGITITNDCEKQQFASTEFIHANIKSDMIVADTHENKAIESIAENHLQQKQNILAANSSLLSPTRQTFSNNNDHHQQLHQQQQQQQQEQQQHQLLHQQQSQQFQQQQQHHHHHYQQQQRYQLDSRLPPDLLPYGQSSSHTLALQNNNSNNNNNSNSINNSITSSAILDFRNQSFTNKMLYDDEDDVESFLHSNHLNDSEKDLRIYTGALTKMTKSIGLLAGTVSPTPSSSSSSATATTLTAVEQLSTKSAPPLPLTRTNYTLTTSSNTSNALKTNQPFHMNNVSNSSETTVSNMGMTSSNAMTHTKLVDNNNCKPRQSIVRTSPSFSFLSTGYQQQDNFL